METTTTPVSELELFQALRIETLENELNRVISLFKVVEPEILT